MWVWGDNSQGQLGDDPASLPDANRALQVSLLPPMRRGRRWWRAHAGADQQWQRLGMGRQLYGQLGDDVQHHRQRSTLCRPSGLTDVVALAAGYADSFALRSDGTVWAWGYNIFGDLGNGTTTRSYLPTPVAGMSAGVTAITSAWLHSLALTLPPVAPPLLTIVADDQVVVYGNALPTLTYRILDPVSGDWQPSQAHFQAADVRRGRQQRRHASDHLLRRRGSSGYQIAYQAGTLTVNPAPLTITANARDQTYGMTVWVRRDLPGRMPHRYRPGTPTRCTTLLEPGTGQRQRERTPSAPSAARNWLRTIIAYVSGTLTVNQAVLTVKANDMTVGSGSVTPTLTATITGFVNGDTTAVLTGEPSLILTGGVIQVGVGALQAANYTFITMHGTLKVTSDALQLFNNYFVTGDFVTGSVALRGTGSDGKATGTITIPDSIPAMAEIVAAYLYWQTVEDAATAPAALQGTFRGYGVNGEKLGGDLPYSDAAIRRAASCASTARTCWGSCRWEPMAGGRPTGDHQVTLPDSGSTGRSPRHAGRHAGGDLPRDVEDGATARRGHLRWRVLRQRRRATCTRPCAASSTRMAPHRSSPICGLSRPLARLAGVRLGRRRSRSLSDKPRLRPHTEHGFERRRLQHAGQERRQRRAAGRLEDAPPAGDLLDSEATTTPTTTPGSTCRVPARARRTCSCRSTTCAAQVTDGVCTGHSHLPKLEALTMVAEAFLAKGIHVHFDVGKQLPGSAPRRSLSRRRPPQAGTQSRKRRVTTTSPSTRRGSVRSRTSQACWRGRRTWAS